jgi:hypothetical protein
VSSAWRPVRVGGGKPRLGPMTALAFNFCLALLPIAAALAFIIIARDQLYAYEYSPAGARVIAERIDRMNGELIQLDFDRTRQWDDLVAMELMADDVEAARGFLLSAPGILPQSERAQMARRLPAGADDAQIELVALDMLTPGTRARYESMVPLLSRRASTALPTGASPTLSDPRDFELMAGALLAEPSTDALQFILTGFSLGLAGEVSPRVVKGAAALLAASRRDDYPQELGAQLGVIVNGAVSVEAFRSAALADSQNGDPSSFANAGAAFRAAVNRDGAQRLAAMLAEIGAMSEAVNHDTAVALLTHAREVRDLAKLRLTAQATGARAAAAAKRLQRDGRLVEIARGQLSFTRDLIGAIALAALALLGLIGILCFHAYSAGRGIWLRLRGEDDLVDINTRGWRPL